MKAALVLLFVVGLLAVDAKAPLLATRSKTRVQGQYIVILNANTTASQINAHHERMGENLIHTYQIGSFKGYSAHLTDSMLEKLRTSPEVQYIEAEQIMTVSQSCSQQTGAVWGLNRISEQALDLNGNYRYTSGSGAGVDSYIIDTGILTTHTEFGTRASWGANFADTTNSDCNGHGTHVAGTVGGKTYGVAKATTLIAVKVLDCAGSGTTTGVVKGIQYAAAQKASRKRPSVANMSLGGGKSAALNDAVTAAVAGGVSFAVAAGNENQDACNVSPASTPAAITVGATTVVDDMSVEEDARASFSNFGRCVSLLAPGELITSAWIGSTTATRTISGTSMASPHVAGAAALYLGNNPDASPATVKSHIVNTAGNGYIDMLCGSSVCTSTPNKILHSSC